ncbi:hypothetical protein FRC14_003935 [Serendipita sp. 396]|nr:hypothetical protein FRC14_003935 [Serendipita sp. 396]KAG8798937.1 hypothetical protein FRC16_006210 [Serendipita sp. 398]KAG8867125.1 hypothetical protein FRC20_006673 [Serendipita sp. 405]KAG9054003.1 hypothetical protein FS842_006506 [Serendipita sp. 407]
MSLRTVAATAQPADIGTKSIGKYSVTNEATRVLPLSGTADGGAVSSSSSRKVSSSSIPSVVVNGRGIERSPDAPTTKTPLPDVKEILNTKPDKNAKPPSVVPNSLKGVGRKLKGGGSIAGLQFNPGLLNLGNSCYLNSTLQGLMSTKLLENIVEFTVPSDFADRLFPERSPALMNGRGEQPSQYELGMETCMTFIRTLENGWKLRNTTSSRQRVSMSARELRNRLGRKYDQYLDFQQQDAHEFLRHLLDCMYMEELDVIKKRQPAPPKRRRGQPTPNPPPPPIPENQRLIPFVDQVFGGQLASMLICSSCKHVSHTYEPFMDLSLSIRSKQDSESKRNRLKAFAQRFTKQSGRPTLRPLSNPPSPRQTMLELELEPPTPSGRRRSLDLLSNRSDSDLDEKKRPTTPGTLSPPDKTSTSEGASTLGRRTSPQIGPVNRRERSQSQEGEPDLKEDAKSKGPSKQEAAYLRRIMANTEMSKHPLELLRAGLGANGTANGDSITAAAASWLRLGPTNGPTLQHCLRQFTAVESLEGDNMVGCSRCWKLANPTYISKRRRRSSQSSSSSSSDESDSDEPSQERHSASGVPAQSTSSVPSISTTSPDGIIRSSTLNGKPQTSSNAPSSTYLTPASSRHGSIRQTGTSGSAETADSDSTSMSDVSGVSLPMRPKEVRLKAPSIPKSQRVLLRRAYKRYLIAVPPPVLVIHLKRFQQVSRIPVALFGSLKKIDDFIAFPEYLDLKPFIAPRREEFGLRPAKTKDYKGAYDEQVMYRLYAVVVHIGNMLGGHYIAYTALSPAPSDSPGEGPSRSNERRWSFQSDQIVRVATLEEVLSAKAYLCFYERVADPSTIAADISTESTSQQSQRKK